MFFTQIQKNLPDTLQVVFLLYFEFGKTYFRIPEIDLIFLTQLPTPFGNGSDICVIKVILVASEAFSKLPCNDLLPLNNIA